MTSNNESRDNTSGNKQTAGSGDAAKGKVTHNLDTGEDEPLEDLEDKSVMDLVQVQGAAVPAMAARAERMLSIKGRIV